MLLTRVFGKSIVCLTIFSLSVMLGTGSAIAQDDQKNEKQDKVDVGELLQAAQADISSEDYAAAAKKLKKITKAQDDNGTAWQLLGYALHLDGKLDEAISAHTRAAEFPQFKQLGLYNLGCAYSLKNEPQKSIRFLHKALDAGFNRFDMFESDADLENVKKAKGFRAINARVKNGGKRPQRKINAKSLLGEWSVVEGTRAGEEVTADRLEMAKITIDKELITIPAGEDEFNMSYEINTDTNPAQIDMKVESGPAPEDSAAVGIIKKEGGKVVLCYNATGGDRPEKFESTAENGNFLFTMKSNKQSANKQQALTDKPDGTAAKMKKGQKNPNKAKAPPAADADGLKKGKENPNKAIAPPAADADGLKKGMKNPNKAIAPPAADEEGLKKGKKNPNKAIAPPAAEEEGVKKGKKKPNKTKVPPTSTDEKKKDDDKKEDKDK